MNELFEEFNLLDVDNESFLGESEEIICRHCKLISYVEFQAPQNEEIIDFSQYNFNTGEGFVVWSCYYQEKGINELTFNNDCMVSQSILEDGSYEFYWWPAGSITFFQDMEEQ